ncbi:PREDICTED: mucin-19-like [Branchiostoma belcheri]|uniref:Mucin-19-like n=1 Tax=Branchiostoma belcheri TaxID=7741 RepID=A0A6P4Y302_BRABE|nr:PREDICTED: mucin-19-like [Branchiostoma belcheri]
MGMPADDVQNYMPIKQREYTSFTREHVKPTDHSTPAGDVQVERLGCWADTGTRAIPTLEGTDPRLDGRYLYREQPFEKCLAVAQSRGFSVFALQNGGWCASSAEAGNTYNMYGPSAGCGADGEGGPWANEVYRITQHTTQQTTEIPTTTGPRYTTDQTTQQPTLPGTTSSQYTTDVDQTTQRPTLSGTTGPQSTTDQTTQRPTLPGTTGPQSTTDQTTQRPTLPGTTGPQSTTDVDQTTQRSTLQETTVSPNTTTQTTQWPTLPGTTVVSQNTTNQTTGLAGGETGKSIGSWDNKPLNISLICVGCAALIGVGGGLMYYYGNRRQRRRQVAQDPQDCDEE